MPLTKKQIIEIQEAAKFNYLKQLKEREDREKLAKAVEKRIQEETKTPKK